MTFSICICTYNRANELKRLLSQLEIMSEWLSEHAELIVINNNSSDHTAEVLENFQNKLNVKVFEEKRQGLSHARNRALKEFKGNALLFLDDDVSVSLASLETYRQLLKNRDDIDYFGGKIVVDWQGEKPQWLKSNDLVLLNGLFGEYDLGDENIEYTDDMMTPFGANFILRRSLIDKVGVFDIKLGVIGDGIGRGEESDYFNRARTLGFNGLYCADALVGHFFQKERVGTFYLYRYGIEKGRAAYYLDGIRLNKWAMRSFGFLIRGIFQLIKCRRDRYYQCVINMGIARGLCQESQQSQKSA